MSDSKTCQLCQLRFNTSLAKKVHDQQVHVYVHQCKFCKTKFSSKENLNAHIESCIEKGKNLSQKCGKFEKTTNKRSLSKSGIFDIGDIIEGKNYNFLMQIFPTEAEGGKLVSIL